MNIKLVYFLLLISTYTIKAQINSSDVPDLFWEGKTMPRIDIIIDSDSLNSLKENIGSSHEYIATMIMNNGANINDAIKKIGIKLRGNGSRDTDRKSYRVSFNTYSPGRKFRGYEKINLKATQDASYIRPKLCWYMFRKMEFPAAWLSHVRLYVNGDYWGVYTNVEHVDEIFIKRNFGKNKGNLYKCRYPSALNYINNDENDYKYKHGYYGGRNIRVYDLKINEDVDDYTDLMELTDALNNTGLANLGSVMRDKINIPQLMKFFALEVYLGHWDSYSGNGNNYYLYNNTETNKFEYLTTDMDFTLGIMFGLDREESNLDIYNFFGDMVTYNGSEIRPPLRHRLLEVDEFKSMYTFYLKQVINSIPPDLIEKKGKEIQEYIYPYVKDDPGFTYSENEFNEMLESGIAADYGIIEYLNKTYSAINSGLDNSNTAPIITNMSYAPYSSGNNFEVSFTTEDEDEGLDIKIYYRINNGTLLSTDITATEKGKLWGAENHKLLVAINDPNCKVDFYLEATDSDNQTSRLPYQGMETMHLNINNQKLFINECMAANNRSITDEYGNRDDWIELYNGNSNAVSLANKYLTDNFDRKDKWALPDIEMQPGEFSLFWADNDTDQGEKHIDFKLSGYGEEVYLFEKNNADEFILLDFMSLPSLRKNISYGRLSGDPVSYDILKTITPGYPNDTRGLAFAVFQVKMTDQIASGDFYPDVDDIDVVGNFNNWGGSALFADENENDTYTYTKFDLSENQEIEFKFRINEDDSRMETTESRLHTLREGCNNIYYMFNGEEIILPTDIKQEYTELSSVTLYPNPAKSYFYVATDSNIEKLQILNLSGEIVYSLNNPRTSNLVVDVNNLAIGMYIVRLKTSNNNEHYKKLIKQ